MKMLREWDELPDFMRTEEVRPYYVILKKKNKWFIAHQDNLEKIASGDYPGLLGRKIIIDH